MMIVITKITKTFVITAIIQGNIGTPRMIYLNDIFKLRHKTPNEILVVFHNGSNYDYHFIIRELAEEFEGIFECLAENNQKNT